MITLGIVGGLGAGATAKLYLSLNKRVKEAIGVQPKIIIDNVNISVIQEQEFIKNNNSKGIMELIAQSVKRLGSVADIIVIPCNSAHVFINNLDASGKLIDIISLCVDNCSKSDVKKVGLLATSQSIKNKLHITPLEKRGIEVIIPNKDMQERLDKLIINLNEGTQTAEDKDIFDENIAMLHNSGAERIILGCTDLSLLEQKKIFLPTIDTLKLLENALFDLLISSRENLTREVV